jgi:hypothetical protein
MTERKVKASIQLDKDLWRNFVGYARLVHRTDASKMIRRYIEEVVQQDSKVKQA